jgi:hypothetical protein
MGEPIDMYCPIARMPCDKDCAFWAREWSEWDSCLLIDTMRAFLGRGSDGKEGKEASEEVQGDDT